jgi:hypothetical protein
MLFWITSSDRLLDASRVGDRRVRLVEMATRDGVQAR